MHRAPEAKVPKHALFQQLLDEDHPSFLLEAQVALLEERGELCQIEPHDELQGVVSDGIML